MRILFTVIIECWRKHGTRVVYPVGPWYHQRHRVFFFCCLFFKSCSALSLCSPLMVTVWLQKVTIWLQKMKCGWTRRGSWSSFPGNSSLPCQQGPLHVSVTRGGSEPTYNLPPCKGPTFAFTGWGPWAWHITLSGEHIGVLLERRKGEMDVVKVSNSVSLKTWPIPRVQVYLSSHRNEN